MVYLYSQIIGHVGHTRTFGNHSIAFSKQKIVIITHYNPDGDAIGSSLGLKHFLKTQGLEAEVIVPNDFPKFLKWMPEARKITIAEYKRKQAGEAIYNADVIFVSILMRLLE